MLKLGFHVQFMWSKINVQYMKKCKGILFLIIYINFIVNVHQFYHHSNVQKFLHKNFQFCALNYIYLNSVLNSIEDLLPLETEWLKLI